jgi:ParB/RepB/Spo0J family partition protein
MNTTFDPALPVADILYDSDFNCRGQFTLQSVKDLADSISQVGGLISPVTVQPWNRDGYKYRLIVGYRRFRAATYFLKWTTIAANICVGLSERDAQVLNFMENLERKNLNIMEEARVIGRLYPDGATIRAAAAELKRPTRWVHIRLRLLAMPEVVQQRAAAGLLSQVNLEVLAGMKSATDQVLAAIRIGNARQRGKGKFLPGLDKACKPRSGVRRRDAINRMVERMLAAGIEGLAPRMGAWCAGYISDDVLLAEILATRNASRKSPDG